MPRHSGHMIRFVLLLLCLGIAGLSPVFAEEGAAPADYDKQERTRTLAVGQDDTYGQLENSMISFMERHRDVLPFRMQPRFRGESFYWELPACQPWLFLLRGRTRTIPAECRKIPATSSFRSFYSPVEHGWPAVFIQRARNRKCTMS